MAARDNAGSWGAAATYTVHLGTSVVLSPADRDRTQRYFTLEGETATTNTSARFQYRFSPTDAAGWRDIPVADVTFTSNGQPIGSWPVTLTAGKTPKLTWNAASTLGGTDGPVQVRMLVGATGSEQPVELELDQDIVGSAAPLGPGSVDLITGNLSVSAADASVGGLGIYRTHNSRVPDEGATGGIFGPGWSSGLESTAMWVSLHENTTAGTVEIAPATGDPIFFVKNTDGTYAPSAADGTLTYTLTFAAGAFTLRESDGSGADVTETTFTKPTGAADYVATGVNLPSSDGALTSTYQVVGTVAQPTQIVEVPPAGVTCSAPLTTRGCRTLRLTYAASTTATGTAEASWGDYAGRVKTASYTAWDPATSQMVTVDVASYLYDSTGRLRAAWDPRITPALKTRYGYDAAGHLTSLTPPGLNAWTITYGTISGDANAGRALSVSRPGVPTGTANTTVVYRVPLTGAGAPYPMGSTDVAGWAQVDYPTDATAIFPPGQDPANPPTSYDWATISYLNRNAREVNTVTSNGSGGGYISTTEYDAFGNVLRTLAPQARATALATGSTTAEDQAQAQLLDTRYVYDTDGIELTDAYGPQHQVQLADGSVVQARAHTRTIYDEQAPAGGPYHLPTTMTAGALVAGASADVDVRTTRTGYDWDLSAPTTETVDPQGLNLVTTTGYDPVTGQVSKTIMPANPAGGDARETRYVYFTADASSGDTACDNKPEWVGLLCKTKPAAQPTTGNNLPVVTFAYDRWGNVTTKTETVPSPAATRTTTNGYDAAGRLTSTAVSGPGTAVPDVTVGYSSATGLPTTTTAAGLTITRGYDVLGRPDTYTDADGNVSSFAYDLRDRPTSVSEGKGTYTLAYDQGTERRGMLTTLTDSQAGAFGASYDAEGALTTQTWPNGMSSTVAYDQTGTPTAITYTKTTNCSADCDWFSEQVTPSVHDQWLARSSSLSDQAFTYDAAGRLTWTHDTVAAQCTTRQYAYDANSNRTSLTTRAPGTGGSCDTTSAGTVISSTYDQADRATKTGYTFDAFGRITQVPAEDDGGQQLTLGYFENDRVRMLTAGAATDTISIDPQNRMRQLATASLTQTWHYVADTDVPSWIAENATGTTWTRNVLGPMGQLAAIADQSGTTLLQVTNLHGDVIATASTSGTATSLLSLGDQTEFGSPRVPNSGRYGWLGGHQRPISSSTILMGARVYIPAAGRFAQVDPVTAGSATAYDYVNQTPLNGYDLSGHAYTYCGFSWWLWGRFCNNYFTKAETQRVWNRMNDIIDAVTSLSIPGLLFYLGALTAAYRILGYVGGALIVGAAWVYGSTWWAIRNHRCLEVDVHQRIAPVVVHTYSSGYCR